MFERFTDTARKTVVDAQILVREVKCNHIDVEHVFSALISGDNAARTILTSFLDIDHLSGTIDAIVDQTAGDVEPQGHIPFTPDAKRILEFSLREALQLGHNYIGTEHILLAIMRQDGPVAQEVALEAGADVNQVKGLVRDIIRGFDKSVPIPENSDPSVVLGNVGNALMAESVRYLRERLDQDSTAGVDRSVIIDAIGKLSQLLG
jgi:ATP-dependent Clp protease ATP-binding subunit ClpC